MGNGSIKVYLITKVFDLLGLIVKASTVIAIAYFVHLTMIEWSGLSTQADIAVDLKFLKPQESSYGLPWVVSFISICWALVERKLRQSKTAQMSSHQVKLEKKIDPHRQSSGLTQAGNTHPEDKKL